MSTESNPRPHIELSTPDYPELRTMAVITKAGDAVIVFKKATVEQLTEDSAPVIMRLVQHLTETGRGS